MSKKFPSARKLIGQLKDLRSHARKVYNYRCDVLAAGILEELEDYLTELDKRIREGSKNLDVKETNERVEQIHGFLLKHGGKIYPRGIGNEVVELIVVAAVVVIGIRTFFLQPFIIPSNSMYPTYNGMLAEVHQLGEEPNIAEKAFRFVTRGARNYEMTAPVSGRVYIPSSRRYLGVPSLPVKEVAGRKWVVLPTTKRAFYFLVDDQKVYLEVPGEFRPRDILEMMDVDWTSMRRVSGPDGLIYFDLGIDVAAGEPILSFDIKLGDALFVDRFSYHFIQPDIGDPFVFRTDDLPDVPQAVAADVRGKYYIKRLVGGPGDELEIREPILFNNGEPVEGAEAFVNNHEQMDEYDGYVNPAFDFRYPMPLSSGNSYTVPEDSFFAMGDNSDNSQDSRYWGRVDKESVIGRAIFIYYPFTTGHWGLAK